MKKILEENNQTYFTGYEQPFSVEKLLCDNPDCLCNEISFSFKGADNNSAPHADTFSFSLRLDLTCWQEKKRPNRPVHIDKLAEEFITNLTETDKQKYQKIYDDSKNTKRRIANYRFDQEDINVGILIPYIQILRDDSFIETGGAYTSCEITHNNQLYIVEDLYCCNPDCHCKEAALIFIRLKKDTNGNITDSKHAFMAKHSFKGKIKIAEQWDCAQKTIDSLLRKWQQKNPDMNEKIQQRYTIIKDIANRNLEDEIPIFENNVIPFDSQRQPQKTKLDAEDSKVSRNAPCPCGSGKKYKKCCL
jgi:hypothetical protein